MRADDEAAAEWRRRREEWERRRLLERLNRQPMPVRRQVAMAIFLAAAAGVIALIGWLSH